jgi:hypothetical protein
MFTEILAINAGDAARRLGIASSTLAKLRLTGAGPVFCKLGRRVVYRLADLDAYLAAHQRQSTSRATA